MGSAAVPEALGPLVRRLRLDADLTLERLAELSGVSDRAISDIERGASLGPQRRTVELLADGLGLDEPGRQGLLAAARAGRRRQPPDPGATAPLPRAVVDFTGRDGEVATVTAHLRTGVAGRPSPVVVICGPPGFGKTSLAVRVGTDTQDFFDEVHFVDLRGFDTRPLDPHSVLARLIQAVTQDASPVPRELPEAAAHWQSVIAGRRLLVVLDNAGTEEAVRPAIPATGPAGVVVTSRSALAGLEDVERVFLDQLAPEEAVALLRKIVPEAQTDGQDLARLAALCDHVPLALRIAGNRLTSRNSWTADDLASRLAAEDRRIDGLRAGDLEIRSAIGLSYDRLTPLARQAFRRLSLLRGATFSDAVAARLIPADLPTAEDLLDELADLGLVQPAAQGRYHLHDLLRLYARERLFVEESPEERERAGTDLRHWLLRVTLDACRWFDPDRAQPPDVPDPLVDLSTLALADAWLRSESEHWFAALRDAAHHGEHALVVDVAVSLHWFSALWVRWGHWHDVYGLGAASARILGDDEPLAALLGYLAWAELSTRSNPTIGLEIAAEAAEVAQRSGSTSQEGWAAFIAGWSEARLGRFDDALAHGESAVALMRAAGDTEGLLQAERIVGHILSLAGRTTEAIAHEQAFIAWVSGGPAGISSEVARFTVAASFCQVATLHVLATQWEEAVAAASEALQRLDAHEWNTISAIALTARGDAAAALGRVDDARSDLVAAIELFERFGETERADVTRAKLAALPGTGPQQP